MQSDQPNRENLPHPRPTLSTRLSRILVHKMVGRLSQGPRDARDRCLPVCELSPGRDCTMRRVLGAILLACGFWPKPAKRVGQSQFCNNPLGIQYRAESNASWYCERREAALDALNDKATQLVAGTQPLTQNFFLVQINRSELVSKL